MDYKLKQIVADFRARLTELKEAKLREIEFLNLQIEKAELQIELEDLKIAKKKEEELKDESHVTR